MDEDQSVGIAMPQSGRKATLVRVFLPFALGYFLSYVFRVVNAVIAPDLVRDLGLGPEVLGLLTSTYFVTFAAFQLPLGVLLDRYGPRRVEAVLLIFAAAGAAVFAQAEGKTALMAGRALIGFGVSACLMAAFKAYVEWFPRERLPLINGLQMASGGAGAIAATAPVEAALRFTDWRGVFWGLAALTLVASLFVGTVVPERPVSRPSTPGGSRLAGLGFVLTSPRFWKVAPWAVASQATFLAIQGLWSGPWLRDVAGLERGAVAGVLLSVAAAMVLGFLSLGYLADRLGRLGVRTLRVAAAGMTVFMGVQIVLLLGPFSGSVLLWSLFGFFGTTAILCYAALSQEFETHLAGRVNTSLNLFVFVAAFAAQWGIGAVIGMFSTPASGAYAPEGYRAAFGAMIAFQAVTALWFVAAEKVFWRMPRGPSLGDLTS